MNENLVVVAGAAGKLGRLVVDELLATPGVKVRALVRDPKKAEVASMASERLELFAFDAAAASAASRAAAVRGAYSVVSTLQGGPDVIVDAQLALLLAAKAAGARRFIPSDYSYNLFSLPVGVNINSDWRRTFAERAKEAAGSSLEVVHVLQGMFVDRDVLGFVGIVDAAAGKVRYWGDGKTPIDWTTWRDTARFTAAAALDDRPVPAHLYVSGDRMDVLAFADAWSVARGSSIERERLGSVADLEREVARRLAAEPGNMFAWLPLMYARGVFEGTALLGPKENARYPHIEADDVARALARGVI